MTKKKTEKVIGGNKVVIVEEENKFIDYGDISKLFQISLQEKFNNEAVKNHIDECTDKLVKNCIDECFGRYSTLSKAVQSAIDKQFDNTTRFDDIPTFKETVIAQVLDSLNEINDTEVKKKMETLLAKMNADIPEKIHAKEIMRKYAEAYYEYGKELQFGDETGENWYNIGDLRFLMTQSNCKTGERIFAVLGGNMEGSFNKMNEVEKYLHLLVSKGTIIDDLCYYETYMFNDDKQEIDEYGEIVREDY